jgi:thiamine pyrophosphate-dependent acetolactate synthase large subunit-like protein
LRPEEALLALREVLEDEDKVIVDLGDHTIAAAKVGLDPDGGTGALGGSMSVALGHCLGTDGGRVYCVVGDGGFFMHLHTLATVAQNRDRFENLTVVVVTDAAWGMTGGQENPAVHTSPADIARSMSFNPAETAESVEEALEVLKRCRKKGPSLVEMRCRPITFL